MRAPLLYILLLPAVGMTPPPTLCGLPVARDLRHPTHLLALDSGKYLVSEQAGHLLQLWDGGRSTILNLEDKVVTSDSPYEERGLLSFALDLEAQPDFLYVCYCGKAEAQGQDHTFVVSRFHLDRSQDKHFRVDESREMRVLVVGQPGKRGVGGYIFFRPPEAGLLYVTLGSGGAGDEANHRFNTSSLLGKVLRLNVSDPNTTYSIPSGNPFVGSDHFPSGSRPEIYSLGFWNPWRCSVDTLFSGRALCGDVGSGEDNVDLVVSLVSGGIYGCPPDCNKLPWSKDEPQRALYVHKHEIGQALIGGHVYRGKNIPSLQGAYLFGDFVHGSLHVLREEDPGKPWSKSDVDMELGISDFYILSISTDYDGELLLQVATNLSLFSASGAVYRLSALNEHSPKYCALSGVPVPHRLHFILHLTGVLLFFTSLL